MAVIKRLTEHIGDGVRYYDGKYHQTCYPKNNNLRPVDELAVKLCEYEDKIENGVLVEFPSKIGDKVAVRALCECVLTTPCYEECRNICPFEDDCECEECDNCNERIFDTKVSAIYDNGSGWVIEFEHLIIQARFTDIGTSFFVGEDAHEQAIEYERSLRKGEGNE